MSKARKTLSAKAKKRRIDVAQLLLRGYSYREMAALYGVSHVTICNDVKAILELWAEETKPEERHNWKLKELRKLDSMERGLAIPSESGDVPSVDKRLKLMERRARLLGLDAPIKLAISSFDIDEAIKAELELLATGDTNIVEADFELLPEGDGE